MHFADLRLSTPILRALTQEGYTTPTPIQAQAIPHVMAGRDVLGCAQTGTGKTAAFALPILDRLLNAPADKSRRGPRKARALVLSPTRELAVQIAESFAAYGRDTGLTGTTIYGGVSQFHQERALRRGVDVIVATPGRLIDLLEQGIVDLSEIQVLVLDEADRMLDMGFIQPIRRIAAATPAARQTLLFSATLPKQIMQLAGALLNDPVRVAVTPVSSAAPKIEQSVYMVGRSDKQDLLHHLLAEHKIERAVVFTRTKHGADRVGKKLARAGVTAETIHGDKAQNYRRRALESFRAGRARVLVATDVAARGLDVDDITHVVNFDLPVEPEAYIHRIGRTGRAGATGVAFSFCDAEERGLLRDIERLTGGKIEVRRLPDALPAAQAHEPRAEAAVEPKPHAHPNHRPHAPRQHAKPRTGAAHPRKQGRPAAAGSGGGAPHGGRKAPSRNWNGPSRRRAAR